MKILSSWVRDFVDFDPRDVADLAHKLTNVGLAVEFQIPVGGPDPVSAGMIFEMEIGTNRPDAMNHYGIAREASAIYGVPLKQFEPKPPKATGEANFPVTIEDPLGCARFTARIIKNVAIRPSPTKIAERMALLDQRPINNAVDATNYTLWEMGKPTHVFDLDLLEGGKIIVRRARDGEKLKTLDGIERKLTSEDLVVADTKKAVGLAGTMGGFDTMITDKTRNILIESAWWDPITVRQMSRRHGLHTDASHRFERGADFESTVISCDRVAELILQSGGGEIIGEPIDVIARHLDQAPIALRISEVRRILGGGPDPNTIVRTLKSLGFDIVPEKEHDQEFSVRVPSWRLDVEREIDLIEEIARLYGYDKFPNTLPSFSGSVLELPSAPVDNKLRTSLLAIGYNEAVSLSFISHAEAEQFSAVPVIEVENPLSEEASVMRTSLVPGMLNLLAYNLNRGNDNVRLFEAANVFRGEGQQVLQLKRICIGATGSASSPNAHQPARALSFYDLKGDVETILRPFQYKSLCYDTQTAEYYHPGRSARVLMDGEPIAQFGQIHPETAARYKLRQNVFIGEIEPEVLYKRWLRKITYEPLPKYPAVQRDFSFIFPDAATFAQIEQAVVSLGIIELRSFVPVEIFRGGSVPAGNFSILLKAMFQSNDRTLREEEVAGWSGRIIKALESLGGTLRSQ